MKKIFTLLLAVAATAVMTHAAIVDGTCGDNLTWLLNTKDSTLTISGSGEMTSTPWSDYKSYIKYVTLPDGLTSIGSGAFAGCSGFISVTIPNSITSIGSGAFSLCSGLTSVIIPNSVTSIGEDAFEYCSSLTSVTIPNSVTSIEYGAFSGCSSLTSVTIPNSVTSIGEVAFSGCSGLTSIVVESGNTIYDSRDNCNAIIETATNTLIVGCMSTIISNSVTSIGNSAFYGCSGLTSVTIPNSVTSIGGYAFYHCSGLTSVTNYATTPQEIFSWVFDEVDKSSFVLYVPKGSVDLYKAADVWKDFGNIIGVDVPEGIEEIPSNKVPSTKLLRNGNVYILTDDKTYTITGQLTK